MKFVATSFPHFLCLPNHQLRTFSLKLIYSTFTVLSEKVRQRICFFLSLSFKNGKGGKRRKETRFHCCRPVTVPHPKPKPVSLTLPCITPLRPHSQQKKSSVLCNSCFPAMSGKRRNNFLLHFLLRLQQDDPSCASISRAETPPHKSLGRSSPPREEKKPVLLGPIHYLHKVCGK